MARAKIPHDEIIRRLTEVFRRQGFDGATLAGLAEGAGLEKASLYHRFPKGKQEMAEVVLDHVNGVFAREVIAPLTTDDPPAARLTRMFDRIATFYREGKDSCVLEVFSAGQSRDFLGESIQGALETWLEALEATLRDLGSSAEKACATAEEIAVRVQGGLVVARIRRNPEVFLRRLRSLQHDLLAPGDAAD